MHYSTINDKTLHRWKMMVPSLDQDKLRYLTFGTENQKIEWNTQFKKYVLRVKQNTYEKARSFWRESGIDRSHKFWLWQIL